MRISKWIMCFNILIFYIGAEAYCFIISVIIEMLTNPWLFLNQFYFTDSSCIKTYQYLFPWSKESWLLLNYIFWKGEYTELFTYWESKGIYMLTIQNKFLWNVSPTECLEQKLFQNTIKCEIYCINLLLKFNLAHLHIKSSE